jgi:hypothetical protein
MKLIAGLVQREEVQGVRENLFSFKESLRTYDYALSVFSISDCAGSNGYFRAAFSVLETLTVDIRAGLFLDRTQPLDFGVGNDRDAKQFGYLGSHSSPPQRCPACVR